MGACDVLAGGFCSTADFGLRDVTGFGWSVSGSCTPLVPGRLAVLVPLGFLALRSSFGGGSVSQSRVRSSLLSLLFRPPEIDWRVRSALCRTTFLEPETGSDTGRAQTPAAMRLGYIKPDAERHRTVT